METLACLDYLPGVGNSYHLGIGGSDPGAAGPGFRHRGTGSGFEALGAKPEGPGAKARGRTKSTCILRTFPRRPVGRECRLVGDLRPTGGTTGKGARAGDDSHRDRRTRGRMDRGGGAGYGGRLESK